MGRQFAALPWLVSGKTAARSESIERKLEYVLDGVASHWCGQAEAITPKRGARRRWHNAKRTQQVFEMTSFIVSVSAIHGEVALLGALTLMLAMAPAASRAKAREALSFLYLPEGAAAEAEEADDDSFQELLQKQASESSFLAVAAAMKERPNDAAIQIAGCFYFKTAAADQQTAEQAVAGVSAVVAAATTYPQAQPDASEYLLNMCQHVGVCSVRACEAGAVRLLLQSCQSAVRTGNPALAYSATAALLAIAVEPIDGRIKDQIEAAGGIELIYDVRRAFTAPEHSKIRDLTTVTIRSLRQRTYTLPEGLNYRLNW